MNFFFDKESKSEPKKYWGEGRGGCGGVNICEQEEHLCQIILKSMHNCRNYGPDKLNL